MKFRLFAQMLHMVAELYDSYFFNDDPGTSNFTYSYPDIMRDPAKLFVRESGS